MAEFFRADVIASQDEIFPYAQTVIANAGYKITAISDRERTISYEASGGGWAWTQKVKLDFNKKDAKTCTLSITVKETKATLTQGGKQRELIAKAILLLADRFDIEIPPGPILDAIGKLQG